MSKAATPSATVAVEPHPPPIASKATQTPNLDSINNLQISQCEGQMKKLADMYTSQLKKKDTEIHRLREENNHKLKQNKWKNINSVLTKRNSELESDIENLMEQMERMKQVISTQQGRRGDGGQPHKLQRTTYSQRSRDAGESNQNDFSEKKPDVVVNICSSDEDDDSIMID